MKIIYLPLEPYRERYTEMLTTWTTSRWCAVPGVELVTIPGTQLGKDGIRTGAVLDAHGRGFWSTTQIANLLRYLSDAETTPEDVVYFDDLFTPGFEALPYLFAQQPDAQRPRIFSRNHAQSVDPDDFVHPMRRWMRRYEEMVYATSAGVICASSAHAELMRVACLDACPVYVLGLPYDHDDVRRRGPSLISEWEMRPPRVIYSSRVDAEKQPHFFCDVVDVVRAHYPKVEFVLCSGAAKLRGSDPSAVERLLRYASAGLIRLALGTTKASYYAELANARVQLNTARQDFISYTAIEASSFGVPTLAPAFRSFPETLRNRARTLYVPWSVEDAAAKLIELLAHGDDEQETAWLARTQHGTLDRILQVFTFAQGWKPKNWWEG